MKEALFSLLFLVSSSFVVAGAPEQLFLDLAVDDVLNGTSGAKTVEPWTSMYCDAISESRYGDAIYARYSIDGESSNGIFLNTNHTIEEEIKLDATNYYLGHPDIYAAALAFYSTNSDMDTRPDIIETLRLVANTNTANGITSTR